MTYHDLVVAARRPLERAGIAAGIARLDADLLARHVLGWDQATWVAHRHDDAAPDFPARYAQLVTRRQAREPVAYIRGIQEFWGREFVVTPAVLIPRPETELLVEVAARLLARHPEAIVADIGTGSGCIAIALALEHRSITVHAVDVSTAALSVARQNARRLGVEERIRFVQGNYLDTLAPPIDLIVSNPPYVRARDAAALSPEVGRHEPAVALFGGDDGLRDVRALLRESRDKLSAGGLLAFEIGNAQLDAVTQEIAATTGLELLAIHDDLQGIPRVVVARRTAAST